MSDNQICVMDIDGKVHIGLLNGVKIQTQCGNVLNLLGIGKDVLIIGTYKSFNDMGCGPTNQNMFWCRKCGSVLTKVFV